MKMKKLLAMAVLGTVGGLFGEALYDVYKTPGCVWGKFNQNAEGQMSKVPTTPTLIFPGATLDEMLDCTFGAWAGAGARIHPATPWRISPTRTGTQTTCCSSW